MILSFRLVRNLGLTSMVLIIIIVGFTAFSGASKISGSLIEVTKNERPMLDKVEDIRRYFSGAKDNFNKFIFEREHDVTKAVIFINKVINECEDLKKWISEKDIAYVNSFITSAKLFKTAVVTYAAEVQYDPTGATSIDMEQIAFSTADKSTAALNKMINDIRARIRAADVNMLIITSTQKKRIFSGVLIGVIVGILAAFIMSTAIARPVRQLVEGTRKMGAGDLTHRINISAKDEIGMLARSFNEMAGRLSDLMRSEQQSRAKAVSAAEGEKEKAEKLQDALNKLEQSQHQLLQAGKMAAVGQLAAGVAHEINNPMTVILGFSQIILKQISRKSPLWMPAGEIEREAARCKNLIDDLLLFSRSAKRQEEDLNLNEVVEKSVDLAQHQTKIENIEIIKDLKGDINLYIEKNGIEQIVINLIVNARDAMPEGGRITVSTWKEQERAFLSVKDTGGGIAPEHLDRIFEPFFTTKEVGRGTGLGLSLIYEIVKRHKGEINVETEKGKGTCFTVSLPIKKRAKTAKRVCKVLIVDDDVMITKMIEDIFKSMGDEFQVYTAVDGYDGILKVGDIKPDLITMDISMPKLDGIKATRQIRKRFSKEQMKIIFITGFPNEVNQDIIKELDIAEVFTKPVSVEQISLVVKNMF